MGKRLTGTFISSRSSLRGQDSFIPFLTPISHDYSRQFGNRPVEFEHFPIKRSVSLGRIKFYVRTARTRREIR